MVICDDSLGFPTLAQTWLREDGRFVVVGVAKTGSDALRLVEAERPDVLLLDLLLPDTPDPAVLVRALREHHPALGILMVSSLQADALAEAARAAGADGTCNKGASAEELTERLYAVSAGAGSRTQNRLP